MLDIAERALRVEEDNGTPSVVPVTNDSAWCIWFETGRSGPAAIGLLAWWFVPAHHGTGKRYVTLAKAVNESKILFLTHRWAESLTVCTDGLADGPLDQDDAFDREFTVHGGE